MELIEVLEKIDEECRPVNDKDCDCRPNSIFKVIICFMCEDETWVFTNPYNPILVPWYHCEVTGLTPDEDFNLQIWLNYKDFLRNNYKNELRTPIGGKKENGIN